MRRYLVPLVLALAMGVAACGGDDDDGGGGGDGRLSTADYREQAQDICNTADEKIDAVETPDNEAGFAEFTRTVQPFVVKAAEDMAALKPPADLQTDHTAYVANLRKAVDAIGKSRTEAEAGNVQAAVAAARSVDELDAPNKALTDRLGLPDCAPSDND